MNKKDINKLSKTKWYKLIDTSKDGRRTITEAYELIGVGVNIKVTEIIENDKPVGQPASQDNTISVAGWFVPGVKIRSTEVNNTVFNELIKN